MSGTWAPSYEPWRHGGWYVTNVRYPSGAVGCVSRNYSDRKWRIVGENTGPGEPGDRTFPNRDAAAGAERERAGRGFADRRANERASFLPMTTDDEKPCVQVAGALVFAYVENGALVVSVDLETAESGTYAKYGPDRDLVPVRVNVGSDPVFEAGHG